MAFVPLVETILEPGKPVRSETANEIRGNFNDHESRLLSLENGSATTFPPLIFRVNGYYSDFGALESVVKTTANFPMSILGVYLLIDVAGTTGTTQIDIKRKRGAGAWTSILSVFPSVTSAAGSDALSSNGVVSPANSTILAGDILRLDLTSSQTGGKGFLVRIDYTRT